MEFQYKEIVIFLGSLLATNFTNARFKFNSSMFTTDKFFTLLTLIRCFISATNTLTLRTLCTSSCLIMSINFHFSFYIFAILAKLMYKLYQKFSSTNIVICCFFIQNSSIYGTKIKQVVKTCNWPTSGS